MAFPSCLLVSMGGRRSQHPGPSPTLESLGSSHQRRYKSRVSLWGPLCTHDVSGTPHEEVRNIDLQSPTDPSELVSPSNPLALLFLLHFLYLCIPNSYVHIWCRVASCLSRSSCGIILLWIYVLRTLKRWVTISKWWLTEQLTEEKNQTMRKDSMPWRGACEKCHEFFSIFISALTDNDDIVMDWQCGIGLFFIFVCFGV